MSTKVNSNIYDFVLMLFTGKDDIRPAMQIPGVINDKVYATDAHTCIRFLKDHANLDYSENKDFPDAYKVFLNLNLNQKKTITVKHIFTFFNDINVSFINDKITCKKCGGEGEKSCPCCDNETTCSKCNGTGEVDNPDSNRCATINLEGKDVFLEGVKLNANYLYKVAQAALLLKVDEINVHYNADEKKLLLFSFDDVEILLMGKYQG